MGIGRLNLILTTLDMNIEDQPKIRVVVRKRPMNRKELARCEQDVIDVRNGSSVVVREMK